MAALACVLITGEAHAQAQMGQAQMGQAQMGQAQMNQGQTSDTKAVDQLHKELRLTPQQDGAWQLYRSAADIPEKAQARRRSASALFPKLDAPRRMDLVEAEMREELSDLQRQSQALKAFYNTLSPDQKRTFDAKTLPPPDDGQGQGGPGY